MNKEIEEVIRLAESSAVDEMRRIRTNDCDASAYIASDDSLCIDCVVEILNDAKDDATEHKFFVSIKKKNGVFHERDVRRAVRAQLDKIK